MAKGAQLTVDLPCVRMGRKPRAGMAATTSVGQHVTEYVLSPLDIFFFILQMRKLRLNSI